MWLAKILIGILVINTLTMVTIVHADRGRPTLKDDERRAIPKRVSPRSQNTYTEQCWQELSTEIESAQIPNFTISFIETKIQPRVQHSAQFDIVYIWISKLNMLNKALLQYISFYLNLSNT